MLSVVVTLQFKLAARWLCQRFFLLVFFLFTYEGSSGDVFGLLVRESVADQQVYARNKESYEG